MEIMLEHLLDIRNGNAPLSIATSAISRRLMSSLAPKACSMTMELQHVMAALELRLDSGGIVPSMSTLIRTGRVREESTDLGRCE